MSEMTSEKELSAYVETTRKEIEALESLEELDEISARLKAKRSPLGAARASLGAIEDETKRKETGRLVGEAMASVVGVLDARRIVLEKSARRQALEDDRLDLTEVVLRSLKGPIQRGHAHLVSQTQDALEDVFVAMGFEVAEGPEVETDWYNFEALNIQHATCTTRCISILENQKRSCFEPTRRQHRFTFSRVQWLKERSQSMR